MTRSLYLAAPRREQAEERYRRISRNQAPVLDCYLSEGACRAHVAAFPPAFRENSRIWLVTERFGPDGRMVTAEDITDRSNVLELRRPAG